MSIKLVIADDHRVFADGLALLLQQGSVADAIQVCDNAQALKALFAQQPFTLALVDIEFGKDDGREVAKALKQQYTDTRFVALSSHSETGIIKSALKGAFSGYLLKTDALDTIKECIQTVCDGGEFISPNTGAALLNDITGNGQTSTLPKLTQREQEVLNCIAKEMSSKEIAQHLFLSEKTVEAHRSNLMLKLDVKNVAGLIRRAFEVGLLH